MSIARIVTPDRFLMTTIRWIAGYFKHIDIFGLDPIELIDGIVAVKTRDEPALSIGINDGSTQPLMSLRSTRRHNDPTQNDVRLLVSAFLTSH
jgi:hypothetical protein